MTKSVCALLLAVAVTLPMAAQPEGGRGHRDPFAELKLTDQQKKGIEGLREKHKAAMEAKRAAMEAARKSGDEAKIKEARKASREAHQAFMKECEPLLTAEQKAEIAKRREERRDRHKK